MNQERTVQKHRMIRFGVLIAVLLLAMYGFFDLTKRLDEAKQRNAAPATTEVETTD